jgi:hypothetical protein
MQATFGTLVGYLGVAERTAVKASCPLEGGGASEGSTCGVVSGGCLAIVLAHLADVLSGEAGKAEALYIRLREYTDWFEREFDSTLCRERCGVDVKEIAGFLDYIFTGKLVTRCVNHIGVATGQLIGLVNRPLQGGGEVSDIDRRLATSGGYCAAEVLRGIRDDTGYGSLYLEQISLAFDGGVGLSGGLCGALAGSLLPMGLIWGIDPKKEGMIGTTIAFLRGHANLYLDRREPELWSVANPFMREFQAKYASLECRDIVGRSFRDGSELAEFMPGSSVCAEIKDWCRMRATELIVANTVFSP